jgi:O-antigen/teichoic acid export membrane protein
MEETSLKDKAVKGVVWNAVNTYSSKGLLFVLGIILARLLSPSDYGLVGMTAIFFAISNVFIDSGFGSALVQKKDRNEDDYCTVFYINLVVSILFFFLLFFIAPFVADFFGQPLLKGLMRVSALTLVISALVSTSRNKLFVAVDFKTITKISLISTVFSSVVALYCAFSGYGVWTLVIQSLVSSVVSALLLFYFVRWIPKKRFSVSSFRHLWRFGSNMLVASLITEIYNNLYSFIIGKRFSAADLGQFSKADNFVSFAGTTTVSVLQSVAFPVLTEVQDDHQRLLYAYRKYIQMIAFVVFPLLMGLCGVAKPLVLFLITEKWLPCVVYLQIMCFASLWTGIIRINLNLLYVTGRSDLVLRLEVYKKAIAFVILFISVFGGVIGMCIGQVFYSLVAFYMNTYYTKKILNYGFGTQVKEIAPSFLLSASMMAIALFISYSITTPVVSLLVSIVACSVYYLGVSYLFRITSLFELREIILSRKNKL